MVFDGFLTVFYLVCGAVGLYRGYRPVFLVIAVVLAISFQYVFGFYIITKLIVALLLGYYFLLPRPSSTPNIEEAIPAPNQTEDSKEPDDEEAIEAVFQEFQNFRGRRGRQGTGQRGGQQ